MDFDNEEYQSMDSNQNLSDNDSFKKVEAI